MKNIQNQDIHYSFRFLFLSFLLFDPTFQHLFCKIESGYSWLAGHWRWSRNEPRVWNCSGGVDFMALTFSVWKGCLWNPGTHVPEVSTMRSIHLSGPTFTVALWLLAGFCPAAQGRCCSRHGASCGIELQNVDLVEVNLVCANQSRSITESLGLAYTVRNFNQFQRISNSSILHWSCLLDCYE